MTSASKDDTADSSIVNVTGSNSVNVYLGIGIPWLAAAIYWAAASGDTLSAWKLRYETVLDGALVANYPSGAFVVQGGALGFSVLIFNCVAISCLVILRVRRLALGGELGGPKKLAYASSATLIFLWISYTGSSIWRNSSKDAEVMIYPLAAIAVLIAIGGLVFELSGRGRFDPEAAKDDAEARKGLKDHAAPEVVVHGVAEDMNNAEVTDNVKDGLEPEKIGASLEIPPESAPNAQEAPVVDAEVLLEVPGSEHLEKSEVVSPESSSALDEGKKKRPSPKKSARGTEAGEAKEKKVPKKKSEAKPKAPTEEPKEDAKDE